MRRQHAVAQAGGEGELTQTPLCLYPSSPFFQCVRRHHAVSQAGGERKLKQSRWREHTDTGSACCCIPLPLCAGITLSPKQVERGTQLAKERGLNNVNFQVGGLLHGP